ncbi:MAG: glycine--tRNA ligase subunit beta [Alphaproteobacteria bacterium TMED194]|nr:MAG: glycine--tRNA ligase subunit beta [Alphaproteobacteria bacterium TMED194]
MTNFLLELMSEEMPASLIEDSSDKIVQLFCNSFKKDKLIYDNYNVYYGPKRLTFIFFNLKNEVNEILIKGPNVKAPTNAIEGFAKSQEVKIDKLDIEKTEKGSYYIIKKKITFSDTIALLRKIMEVNLVKVPWKKSMRWGNGSLKWIRPLKNILCLYGTKKINIDLLGCNSQNYTLHSNLFIEKKIKIKSLDDYKQKLKRININFDHKDRKKIILKEVDKITKKKGLNFVMNQQLIDEVVNLVESPNVFLGQFNKKYLKLPNEVLTTSMIKNQKYFPLFYKDNTLSNFFLIVSNLKPSDNGKKIIYGNQRVIEARLEDASFFWIKDNNSNFKDKGEELKRIIFHNKLGSMNDKILRLKKIAIFFAENIKLENESQRNLDVSINICKNDLVTELVREFPSLQGTMGYYYSQKSGFNKVVCSAIKDHYKPNGPNDSCPSTKLSRILALIDKMDSLVGFFLIDLGPTSSKDPYALRRSGLGIIRIMIEGKFNIKLNQFIEKSIREYSKKVPLSDNNLEKYKNKILIFILDRFENLIKSQSLDKLLIFKALKLDEGNIDIHNIYKKCEVIFDFMNTLKGKFFLKSFKRVLNILESENKLLLKTEIKNVNTELLQSKYEEDLFNTFKRLKQKNLDFNELLKSLVTLSQPINIFFEKVQINDKNILLKTNRLYLLFNIKNYVVREIDFSKIIKGKEL